MPNPNQNIPGSSSRLHSAQKGISSQVLHKAAAVLSSGDQKVQQYRAGARAPLWDFARSLALGLDQRWTPVVPREFVILTRNDIQNILSANRFRKGSGQELLGDYYCLYGALGGSVSVGASIDLGELTSILATAPLGINLSLNFALTAGAGATGEILLMTHKAFERTKFVRIWNPQPYTGTSCIDRGVSYPVSLLNLQGYQREGSVGITLSSEAGIGSCISIAGLPLQINLASFKAGSTLRAYGSSLEDIAPMHYVSALDSNLADNLYAYSSPGREELKIVIDRWRLHLKDKVWDKQTLKGSTLGTLLDQSQAFHLTGRAASDQVLTWLDDLKKILQSSRSQNLVFPEIISQIGLFEQALNYAKYNDKERDRRSALSSPTGFPKTFIRTLTFSICSEAGGSIGPSASASPGIGLFSAEFSAVAQASASVKGEIHFVSERYQIANIDKQNQLVVYTQDTKTTYSNVLAAAALEISAGVSASANEVKLWESPQMGTSIEKTRNRKDLLYHSANINRRHGQDLSISGSGLAIGLSVDLRIIDLLRKASPQEKEIILKKRPFHLYLGVTKTQLLDFFDSIPSGYLTELQAFAKVVIIEANYELKNPEPLARNAQTGYIENLVDKFFQNSKPEGNNTSFYLPRADKSIFQALRCRVRSGEMSSNSRKIFKLGFSAFIGFSAEAQRIKRAGNSFLEDIYVKNYREQEAYLTVPPTVLLPHTLELF